MRAEISIVYMNYARMNHTASFTLYLYDKDNNIIQDFDLGQVEFDKEYIEFEGGEVEWPNVFRALWIKPSIKVSYLEE